MAIWNLEIWDILLLKAEINMFLLSLERFLSDIRGPRYLHLKKVYFFVGHPVYWICPPAKLGITKTQSKLHGICIGICNSIGIAIGITVYKCLSYAYWSLFYLIFDLLFLCIFLLGIQTWRATTDLSAWIKENLQEQHWYWNKVCKIWTNCKVTVRICRLELNL